MSSSTDHLQLASRLRSISRDDGSIDAAQVRVIGLDEIRQAAGPNWPRMRERVRTGSMEILSRHASADDVIVPAGDGFLVMLAKGAPGNNQERCKKMREALLAFYLGDEAFLSLRPEVIARTLSEDGLVDLMSTGVQTECSAMRHSSLAVDETIVEARVFSMRDSKIAARWYAPMRRERGTRRLAYDRDYILDGHHHEKQFFDLDVALIERISLESSKEARAPLGFTVHASTMQARSRRQAYLAQLASLPAPFRKRAIITIAEIEKGTPLISIAEWCSGLRALVGHVCLDFHYTDHALSSIGAAGAWAAGFHLPIYSGAQSGPRAARTLDQIRFWSKTIRGQGMRLAINGFQDSDFLNDARAAGVDIATSDVLWPFTPVGVDSAHGPQPQVSACQTRVAAMA